MRVCNLNGIHGIIFCIITLLDTDDEQVQNTDTLSISNVDNS